MNALLVLLPTPLPIIALETLMSCEDAHEADDGDS